MRADLSIAEAKSQTQDVDSRIIDLIPSEYAAEVSQQPEGVLLACDDSSVTWVGGAIITIQGAPDFTSILEDVQSSFDTDEQSTSTLEPDNGDGPVLTLKSRDGGIWIVRPMKAGETLDITSSSPCFTTPEGMQPSDRY